MSFTQRRLRITRHPSPITWALFNGGPATTSKKGQGRASFVALGLSLKPDVIIRRLRDTLDDGSIGRVGSHMAEDDVVPPLRIGAIVRQPDAGVPDSMEGFARILQGQGYFVRGLVQRNSGPGGESWPRSVGQNGGLVKLSPGSFYAAIGMIDTVSGACPGDGVGTI
jgi:hypothetical protein